MSETLQQVRYKSLDFLGYPDYEVGDDGSVWSLKRGERKQLKTSVSQNGRGGAFCRVTLNGDKWIPRNFKVHTMVLTAFVGPRPPGMVCRHFPDPDVRNNSLSNLQWGSLSENANDKKAQGSLKLTPEIVGWIHKWKAQGKTYRRICELINEMWGVSIARSNVGYIVLGINWKEYHPSRGKGLIK